MTLYTITHKIYDGYVETVFDTYHVRANRRPTEAECRERLPLQQVKNHDGDELQIMEGGLFLETWELPTDKDCVA